MTTFDARCPVAGERVMPAVERIARAARCGRPDCFVTVAVGSS